MSIKLLFGFVMFGFLNITTVHAQCLEAENGVYPSDTYEPICSGFAEVIVDDAYGGEYSKVQVSEGQIYTFLSDLATDFLTISNEAGTIAYMSGVGSITWTATETMVVRFYTHDDATCAASDETRSRIITCGNMPICEDPFAILPYTNGFEDFNVNACLSYEDVNGGTESGWEISDDFPTAFGEFSMVYTYDSDLPGDDWFFTPRFAMTAETSYTLTFKYRGGIGILGYLENLEVKYGTTASADAMLTSLIVLEDIDTSFDSDFDTAMVTFTPTASGDYFIGFRSYSDADQGYIQIDDIEVTASLSTENHSLAALSVSPNPVKNILHLSSASQLTSIEVYNLVGQQIITTSDPSTAQVDMSSLSAGTYIIKAATPDEVKTIKVVKQ